MHPLLLLLPLIPTTLTQSLPIIYINPLNYTGADCPPSTLYTSIISNSSPDPSNSTFLYQAIKRFQPLVGPGTKLSDSIRNCTVYLDAKFSEPKWRLLVNQRGMGVKGYMPMAVGTAVSVRAVYEWVGMAVQIRT